MVVSRLLLTAMGNAFFITDRLLIVFSAQVNLEEGDIYFVSKALGTQYKVAQLHFHWGKNGSAGSEHRINGKMFHLEVCQHIQLGDALLMLLTLFIQQVTIHLILDCFNFD